MRAFGPFGGYAEPMREVHEVIEDSEVEEALKEARRTIGKRIAGWRRLRGIKSHELATRAAASHDTVRGIESGRAAPSVEMMLRFAIALDLKWEQLVAQDPPPPARD